MNQGDLVQSREQYKTDHERREAEAERLEAELSEVGEQLETLENNVIVEGYREVDPYERPHPSQVEVVRYYQMMREWEWKIERRLRELIRWEREDLEWLDKLEGRRRARDRANRGERTRTYGEDGAGETPAKPRNRQHRKRSHE